MFGSQTPKPKLEQWIADSWNFPHISTGVKITKIPEKCTGSFLVSGFWVSHQEADRDDRWGVRQQAGWGRTKLLLFKSVQRKSIYTHCFILSTSAHMTQRHTN